MAQTAQQRRGKVSLGNAWCGKGLAVTGVVWKGLSLEQQCTAKAEHRAGKQCTAKAEHGRAKNARPRQSVAWNSNVWRRH